MRFKLPALSVRLQSGKLSIGRPAPPEPPKPPTVNELIQERTQLSDILSDKRIDSAAYPPNIHERIRTLDSQIAKLAGTK